MFADIHSTLWWYIRGEGVTNHLSAAVIPCEPCVGRRVNSPSGSSGLDNQANGSTPFYIYIYVRTLRASVHIQVTMGIVSVYKGESWGWCTRVSWPFGSALFGWRQTDPSPMVTVVYTAAAAARGSITARDEEERPICVCMCSIDYFLHAWLAFCRWPLQQAPVTNVLIKEKSSRRRRCCWCLFAGSCDWNQWFRDQWGALFFFSLCVVAIFFSAHPVMLDGFFFLLLRHFWSIGRATMFFWAPISIASPHSSFPLCMQHCLTMLLRLM